MPCVLLHVKQRQERCFPFGDYALAEVVVSSASVPAGAENLRRPLIKPAVDRVLVPQVSYEFYTNAEPVDGGTQGSVAVRSVASRRPAHKPATLLGVIAFKAASFKRKGRALRFCGQTFRLFECQRLEGLTRLTSAVRILQQINDADYREPCPHSRRAFAGPLGVARGSYSSNPEDCRCEIEQRVL